MKKHYRWGALGFGAAILPTLLVSELLLPHEPCACVTEAPAVCRDQVWEMGFHSKATCPAGALATTVQHGDDEFVICNCVEGAPLAKPDASVESP